MPARGSLLAPLSTRVLGQQRFSFRSIPARSGLEANAAVGLARGTEKCASQHDRIGSQAHSGRESIT